MCDRARGKELPAAGVVVQVAVLVHPERPHIHAATGRSVIDPRLEQAGTAYGGAGLAVHPEHGGAYLQNIPRVLQFHVGTASGIRINLEGLRPGAHPDAAGGIPVGRRIRAHHLEGRLGALGDVVTDGPVETPGIEIPAGEFGRGGEGLEVLEEERGLLHVDPVESAGRRRQGVDRPPRRGEMVGVGQRRPIRRNRIGGLFHQGIRLPRGGEIHNGPVRDVGLGVGDDNLTGDNVIGDPDVVIEQAGPRARPAEGLQLNPVDIGNVAGHGEPGATVIVKGAVDDEHHVVARGGEIGSNLDLVPLPQREIHPGIHPTAAVVEETAVFIDAE